MRHLLFFILLMVGSAGCIDALQESIEIVRGAGPDVSVVQDRLDRMDAAGDMTAYRMDALLGGEEGVPMAIRFDPAAGIAKVDVAGYSMWEQNGSIYSYVRSDDGTFIMRDHGGDDAVNFGANLTARDGRTYKGTDGEGGNVTLTLDDKDRFATYVIVDEWLGNMTFTFDYASATAPTLPAEAIRVPLAITDIDVQSYEIKSLRTKQLWELDASVPAADIEAHFVSKTGSIVHKVALNQWLDSGGYVLKWMDGDQDGLVDDRDRIEYRTPDVNVTKIRFYDTWAGMYSSDFDKDIPGVGLATLLAVVLVGGVLRRRA